MRCARGNDRNGDDFWWCDFRQGEAVFDAQGIDFRPERPALVSAGIAERTSLPMHTLLTTTATAPSATKRATRTSRSEGVQ